MPKRKREAQSGERKRRRRLSGGKAKEVVDEEEEQQRQEEDVVELHDEEEEEEEEEVGKDEEPEEEQEDLFELLGVSRKANKSEIRKEYLKKARLYHPDKTPPKEREEAQKKFVKLGEAYKILSDPKTRERYEKTGSKPGDDWGEDVDISSWSSFFSRVSRNDIDEFQKQYVNSEEEISDIKKAYLSSKGDMDVIFDSVPFSNPLEDETRFREIIDDLRKKKEVPNYLSYIKEPEKKRKKRLANAQKEAKEAEKWCLSKPKQTKKKQTKKKETKEEEEEDDEAGMEELRNLIQGNGEKREKRFDDLISKLENQATKKGTKGKKGRKAKRVKK